jgi:peptidoglycan/xylan/chitin deacetylase (PgdA/CDA1 family)
MGWSRNLARFGLVGLSKLMSLSAMKRLVGRDFYVVNYHSIAGADDDPYINDNIYRTAHEFEQDLRFYKNHFNILSSVDLIDLIVENRPFPKDSMVLTFDDGLRINYDYQVPILKKHDVTATFFLCSAFVDNQDLHYGRKKNLLRQRIETADDNLNQIVRDYLSDNRIYDEDVSRSLARIGYRNRGHIEEIAKLTGLDFRAYLLKYKPYLDSGQIREMVKDGFTIGAHSVDHPRYGELSLQEQLWQTINSMEDIASRFELNYKLFAFPYSDEALTAEFYEEIGSHVDLTFGMGGFVDDPVSFNIQRGEVESTQLPIELALKYRLLLAYIVKISSRTRGKMR